MTSGPPLFFSLSPVLWISIGAMLFGLGSGGSFLARGGDGGWGGWCPSGSLVGGSALLVRSQLVFLLDD